MSVVSDMPPTPGDAKYSTLHPATGSWALPTRSDTGCKRAGNINQPDFTDLPVHLD